MPASAFLSRSTARVMTDSAGASRRTRLVALGTGQTAPARDSSSVGMGYTSQLPVRARPPGSETLLGRPHLLIFRPISTSFLLPRHPPTTRTCARETPR